MKAASSKNITMEIVAQKAGVSITTVSHVINKTRHVNKETKNAVLQAIKELDYRCSKAERPSANGQPVNIGVILADAREDYFTGMIKTLESAAADYVVSLIFCDSEANFEKEGKNIVTLLEKDVRGLLIAPVDADHIPPSLTKTAVPVVLIDRQYESHNFLFVGINNFQSSYHGTNYLRKKGGEKIGFVGYSGSVYTIRQRVLGYKAAIAETGGVPQVLCLSYSKEDSFPLIKDFITGLDIDSIVCATSSLCYEVIEVLDTLDHKIQEKIKIISYDDNRWLDYLKYPVSVISQPIAEIGAAAVENLLQLIEQTGGETGVKRELLFDTSIIDRIK